MAFVLSGRQFCQSGQFCTPDNEKFITPHSERSFEMKFLKPPCRRFNTRNSLRPPSAVAAVSTPETHCALHPLLMPFQHPTLIAPSIRSCRRFNTRNSLRPPSDAAGQGGTELGLQFNRIGITFAPFFLPHSPTAAATAASISRQNTACHVQYS
ncbi:hypothetical protein J6590_026304 [Homalodisca vitripennis]|nr:hypothetical protein J6590_026304 [Homalodisca vitripennis]